MQRVLAMPWLTSGLKAALPHIPSTAPQLQEHLLMSEHRRETKRMRAGGRDAVVNMMTVKQQEQIALKELVGGCPGGAL